MKKAQVEGGVVVNIIEVDGDKIPAAFADWPEVTSQAIGWTFDGTSFSPPEIPAPTNADVDAERDRRILAGTTFPVTAGPNVPVAGDDVTIRNLTNLGLGAQLQIAAGNGAATTQFRDDANQIHDLTQPQILELWQLGAAFVSAHFAAAWALKDNPSGVPFDYADDSNWP